LSKTDQDGTEEGPASNDTDEIQQEPSEGTAGADAVRTAWGKEDAHDEVPILHGKTPLVNGETAKSGGIDAELSFGCIDGWVVYLILQLMQ
jgi:bifunctional N-acetylglucosamine-1-phosphate-uridyltransferase/glucosamine-1-phosphate-acetyltransferase GlmU-like protein